MAEQTTPSEPAVDELLADPAVVARLTGRSAEDTELLDQLRTTSDRFRREAGQHIYPLTEQAEAWLDGDGSRSLLLPACPVVAVRLVEVDGHQLAERDYQWSAKGMIRRTAGQWPDALRSVRVLFDHGHAERPGDVADVVTQFVRLALTGDVALGTLTVGGESFTFNTVGVTAQWAATVARYSVGRGDRA